VTQLLTQRPTDLIEGVPRFPSLLQGNDRIVGYSQAGCDYFLLNPPDLAFTCPSIQCCVTRVDKKAQKKKLSLHPYVNCLL
jgi:hypothetical protein